ncbi:MarR family winged helix-turn-helix transcriptional regulator [Stratiformator vulcanicus]|uniref:Multiple antibiotic resistance protein MarR n=1 Tax=Stratiformator vulcanicus TaxID=2527980 RepID=A0A517R7M0_9PLAN|nr:MarR family transcriptional regulator [Stratiformator vulcanicus]QDT39884.1 Multiple antibiotic resistance protein MarR [Stratiformator vulcanicus]
MLEHDFDTSIGFWVFTAAHAMEASMNEALAPLGITSRQVQILGCLAVHGEITQNELAEKLRVEPSSVVRMLDRMERDDWIERVVDPNDRRKRIIRAKERAEPVWNSVREVMAPIKAHAMSGVSESELATARGVLQKICRNLSADVPCELQSEKEISAAISR